MDENNLLLNNNAQHYFSFALKMERTVNEGPFITKTKAKKILVPL